MSIYKNIIYFQGFFIDNKNKTKCKNTLIIILSLIIIVINIINSNIHTSLQNFWGKIKK